jgi:hypothetical protein
MLANPHLHPLTRDNGDGGDSGSVALAPLSPTVTTVSCQWVWSATCEKIPHRRWLAGMRCSMSGAPGSSTCAVTSRRQASPKHAWQQWKQDAFELFATHGPRLVALGWRTEELFGLHHKHAASRRASQPPAWRDSSTVAPSLRSPTRSRASARHQHRPDLPPNRPASRRRAGVGTA